MSILAGRITKKYDILLNMDKHKVTLLVLVDFSAAFDTINHVTMKNILENDFGFRDTALQWIISFFSLFSLVS